MAKIDKARFWTGVLYPENMKEGVYRITFSTEGREFKIHTTDYTEVGQEVGLTFFPEDIHVMSRMVY